MATKRDTGSRSTQFRNAISGYLSDFGTALTLRKNTRTTDNMGRTTAFSTATSTIQCDIQWVTKWNIDKVNAGDVQVGDGILFVKHDEDIDIDDQVEYSSDYWRIITQVEGEQLAGDVVYKAFIIRLEKQ